MAHANYERLQERIFEMITDEGFEMSEIVKAVAASVESVKTFKMENADSDFTASVLEAGYDRIQTQMDEFGASLAWLETAPVLNKS